VSTWIALFRGINVGGKNSLPMKSLTATLEAEGLSQIRTYIQSGNVVFESRAGTASSLAARIARAVAQAHGFAPKVFVLVASDLKRAAAANPFPAGEAEPNRLHLFFLAEKPKSADLTALNRLRAGREMFEIRGKVFYMYAPDGMGTSKLGAAAERHLGVDATARNWRTVAALLAMAH
jgi:uncharacterized protein (DUF1697 family)